MDTAVSRVMKASRGRGKGGANKPSTKAVSLYPQADPPSVTGQKQSISLFPNRSWKKGKA